MLELAVGILLATGAVYFVLRPVLRSEGDDEGWGEAGVGDEGEDPEDDLSPRAVALRALKEIEFDRATGKLSDADYEALEREYTAAAVAALPRPVPSLRSRAPLPRCAPPTAPVPRPTRSSARRAAAGSRALRATAPAAAPRSNARRSIAMRVGHV